MSGEKRRNQKFKKQLQKPCPSLTSLLVMQIWKNLGEFYYEFLCCSRLFASIYFSFLMNFRIQFPYWRARKNPKSLKLRPSHSLYLLLLQLSNHFERRLKPLHASKPSELLRVCLLVLRIIGEQCQISKRSWSDQGDLISLIMQLVAQLVDLMIIKKK